MNIRACGLCSVTSHHRGLREYLCLPLNLLGPCPSLLWCLANLHPYLLRQILASALILERQVKGAKSQVQIPSDGEGSGLRLNPKISILLKNTFMEQMRFCDALTEPAYHISVSYWSFLYSHDSRQVSHKSFPIYRCRYESAIDRYFLQYA